MAKIDPNAAAEKWSRNLGQATADIERGVARVTEAPGVAAARQRQVWLAKLQASQDKWARRVASVSAAEWQQAMVQKGIPRIAAGAEQARPKFAQFMSEFLPHLDAGIAQLRTMPKGTLQDAKNRAAFMIEHNARFRRGGRAPGGQ